MLCNMLRLYDRLSGVPCHYASHDCDTVHGNVFFFFSGSAVAQW